MRHLHSVHDEHHRFFCGDVRLAGDQFWGQPLVPNGRELVATLMFEVDDPSRRATLLSGLGGVEDTLSINIEDHVIKGVPEADVDRTSAAGKASAIQFIHFPFSDQQISDFRDPKNTVMISINHKKYGHIAIMPEVIRAALSKDFD